MQSEKLSGLGPDTRVGSSTDRLRSARVGRHLGLTTAGLGILVASLASMLGADAAQAQWGRMITPSTSSGVTLLSGDGNRDKLNMVLVPQNGTTQKMLETVAKKLVFLISPTDEFKDKTNVFADFTPGDDPQCDQNGECNNKQAITNRIDKLAATGLVSDITVQVIKSNDPNYGNGRSIVPDHGRLPDIHDFDARVVLPTEIDPNEDLRMLNATLYAHEAWGHVFGGFGHEGKDVMDSQNCQGSACLSFNTQHADYLRRLIALGSYRFTTPKNNLKFNMTSAGSATPTGGPRISVDNSAANAVAFFISTPQNTQQLFFELRAGNNATSTGTPPVVFDYTHDQALIHAYDEIGRKVPNLPAGTYTAMACSSGIKDTLSTQPLDSKWTQVEGWPGNWFDNPCATVTFNTGVAGNSAHTIYLPNVPKGGLSTSPRH